MTLDGVNARLILALGATRRRGVVSPRARRVCAALAALCALVALANRLFPAVDETEATTPRRRLADYRALFLAGHLCFDYFVEPYAGPYFCLAPQPCFGGVDFVSCQRNSLARALQGTADSF
jgi:peptidoglycan/LPS O-acetylase OafA/YrhL